MSAWSVQIISSWIAKVNSRRSHHFSAAMLVSLRGIPTWQLLAVLCNLCKIFRQIFAWGLVKRAHLKLGEKSYLCICYDTIISWLYSLNDFRIILQQNIVVYVIYQIRETVFNRDIQTPRRVLLSRNSKE